MAGDGLTRSEDRKPLARRPSPAIPRWVGVGLFIYLTIFALSYAKLFLIPVIFAFLLSMVFSPVRRLLDRLGLPTFVSTILIMLALVTVLSTVAASLAVPVSGWINNAGQIERQIEYKLNDISGPFSGFFRAKKQLEEITNSNSNSNATQKVELQGNGITDGVAQLGPTILAQCTFTLVLLLFLLASGNMFYEKIVHVMPTLHDKKRATRVVYAIERKLSRYLLTITLINLGLGVAVGCALWLLGMPNPLLFGLIAFVFNYVPYLGAVAGIAIAAFVALLTFKWVFWSLIVAGIYLALTTIEGQFVTPYFVGRSLRLNTVVVFVTISFWAWLWSAVGMIIAVPILVALKTFGEHIDGLEPLSDFLAERHGEIDDQ